MQDSPRDIQSEATAGWQLNPQVRLHWRHLGDAWVVFEVLSGLTHHLEHVCAAVLMCFEPGLPLSWPGLLQQLSGEFGISRDSAGQASLQAMVDQFAALGLIVRCAAPQAITPLLAGAHAAV